MKRINNLKYQIPETDSSFDPSKVCRKFSIEIENESKNILCIPLVLKLHCVANVYAVLPVSTVKCLCSRERE